MKILNAFDYYNLSGEYNDGESDIDLALYMPTEKKVEMYIRSGETLEDNRRLQYHSDMLNDMEMETYQDPLLYRGYDRSDLELMHKEAIEEILAKRRFPEVSTAPQEATEEKQEPQAAAVESPEKSPDSTK